MITLAMALAAAPTTVGVDPLALLLLLLGSIVTAIGLTITSVIRGWLVPKSSHERELDLLRQQLASITQILNARIVDVTAEREVWRSVARDFETVNTEVRAQNRMLLEQGKTATYAIDQIRRALDQIGMVLAAGARPGDAASIRAAIDEIRATLAEGSTEVAS